MEKISIISDVHDNLANLQKVLDYCAQKKIKTMIFCGDLGSEETLDFLNDNFSGNVHLTFGNADWEWEPRYASLGKYKKTLIYKDFGEIELEKKKVAFVHYPEKAKELCETEKYDFVFHGHTHKPWISSANTSDDQEKEKCTILNPGNVAGTFYPPTFAIWETENDKFELIRIHDLK